MNEHLHKKLNQTIHQPVRLQIMTYLHLAKSSNFTTLKGELGVSDGNLGSHLAKLEDEGLVRVQKKFVLKKPLSQIEITAKGETELLQYLDVLKGLIT